MATNLDGKVAFVTGGSRGIGAATAIRLAEDGADVAFTYERNAEAAATVVDRIKAAGRRGVAMRVDNADAAALRDAVDQTAAEFGRLDILVNNAGAYLLGGPEELDLAEFDRTVAVNIRGPFVAAKAALRHLTEGGRIINIGSIVADRVMFPGFQLYSMSKFALGGLTKALARDLGPRGITVNMINPGPTDTALNPADGPNAETIAGLTALGRYGTPEDVADAVSYLAGSGARNVTGAALAVDGGFNT
jgi:3-oxoacyl-[acyl-carrier protein] reductase